MLTIPDSIDTPTRAATPTLPFAWATDIHTDHLDQPAMTRFVETINQDPNDLLLLTGDISYAGKITYVLDYLAKMTTKTVLFVLGNHDYYRGSLQGVKEAVSRIQRDNLLYLESTGALPINEHEYIVGVDGYADGRAGNLARSMVWLNDYELTSTFTDIVNGPYDCRDGLKTLLNKLGDQSAERFKKVADHVPDDCMVLYVATHAPPFTVAHFAPNGTLGDADWSPHFVNVALGDAILLHSLEHPHRRYVVLCGHTHTGGTVEITDRVKVHVGWASYGSPVLQQLDKLPDRTIRRSSDDARER